MFNTLATLDGGSINTNNLSPDPDSIFTAADEPRRQAALKPIFSKVFRWQPSATNTSVPKSVAVVGSFTDWRVMALLQAANRNTWQLTLLGIPGQRTHRYMLLVDGQPARDPNADGLAVPENAEERRFQLVTPRGPRVFLLFAQAK